MSALRVESSRSIGDHIRLAAARVDLGADAMHDAVNAIMSGDVSPAQIAALLVALALKGETAAEIAGAAMAMRAHAVRCAHHGATRSMSAAPVATRRARSTSRPQSRSSSRARACPWLSTATGR